MSSEKKRKIEFGQNIDLVAVEAILMPEFSKIILKLTCWYVLWQRPPILTTIEFRSMTNYFGHDCQVSVD